MSNECNFNFFTKQNMKSIWAFIILAFLMIPSFQVQAFESKIGEELDIIEVVNDDLYIAGGRVNINAPINGDLTITGGELNINGDIAEDANIAWGDILVTGSIGDDLRVAGGNVRIESNVEWDLVVLAGDVQIAKWVVISWDLSVYAGRVVINGEVLWNTKMWAWELVLNGLMLGNVEVMLGEFKNPSNTWKIGGNLDYESSEKLTDLEAATTGEVIFKQSDIRGQFEGGVVSFFAWFLLLEIIGLFIFGSLILLYFEKMFSSVSKKMRKYTWKSFVYGLLTFIATPILIVLLAISVIWIPFALFLLFAYIFMFVFITLLNVMVLSSFVIHKYKIQELYKKLLIVLWFAIILGLVNGINILIGLFTVGAITLKKIDVIEKLRK